MTQATTFTERLKINTKTNHQSVDDLVMSVNPFANKENYSKFLQLQHVFHQLADNIYKDPKLNEKIRNLAQLARFELVEQDLADLGSKPADLDLALPEISGNEAIGWLYCAEGSNLGAAFLYKEAKQSLAFDENNGARHLAAHPDGRGKHWRSFVAELNNLNLSESEQDIAIEAAKKAFDFYREALKKIFVV